jgi:hypothetical protein
MSNWVQQGQHSENQTEGSENEDSWTEIKHALVSFVGVVIDVLRRFRRRRARPAA